MGWLTRHRDEILVAVVAGVILMFLGFTGREFWASLGNGDSLPVTPAPVVTPTSTAEPLPSLLQQLSGTWTILDWSEQPPGPVELGMDVVSAVLEIDDLGNAFWLVEIDHGGPSIDPLPKIRCLGQVDVAQRLLIPTDEPLEVNGQRTLANWAPAGNVESFPADVRVAFCGLTRFSEDQLHVFDTTQSSFGLQVATAGDGSVFLSMTNEPSRYRWVPEE